MRHCPTEYPKNARRFTLAPAWADVRFTPKADIAERDYAVRFVPKTDIKGGFVGYNDISFDWVRN
jgi:hypothetical protein